ncbi:MAG: hypothetical protein FJ276_00455 [Planctomycetes bacterium]|nr:hypothetical protein [Planctomycetota bacterium]
MIFTNPWGLLALLSIPAILGLHFFRSHRQVREIGGLHLWQFAATRQPIGSRWTRLLRSLSLLFQLLAATLLSLLIAGLDFPRDDSAEHFVIIVDDSVSMTARGEAGDTPADRVRTALQEQANAQARFTLVVAGTRPQVIAGPYAEHRELLRQFGLWQPRAPSCDLSQAVQLASRFATDAEKMLFVTDQPDQANEYGDLLEVLGVGEPLNNCAIVFADRVRIGPDRDRVFVSLQAFGREEVECRLTLRAGDQPLDASIAPRRLSPGVLDSLSFHISVLDQPIEISLDADSLAADNRVVLAPVPVRNIRVHADRMEPLDRFLSRSVEATPFAFNEPDAQYADLVFCRSATFPPPLNPPAAADTNAAASSSPEPAATADGPFPQALLDQYASATLICTVPTGEDGAVDGVARGLDILADSESLITQGLPLEEGIVWPFRATSAPRSCTSLLTTANTPLLFGGPVNRRPTDRREFYYLNLVPDRTNIHQTSLFPVLIRNLIEHVRRIVPGMSRTNYRVGEQVPVSLELPAEDASGTIELLRNGELYERFDGAANLPRLLDDLEAGTYQFRSAAGRSLALFCANFFSPTESDLSSGGRTSVDFQNLDPGTITRTTADHRLFLVLAVLAITFTGLSWISQDSAR